MAGRLIPAVTLVVAQVVALPIIDLDFSRSVQALNAMSVVKRADPANGGDVSPGNTITYSVDVTNSGDEPLTFLQVADTLPAGVTYVPGSSAITGARQVRQYRDEFDLERYDNSNGVTNWSGSPWTEPFDGGEADGGDIKIDVDKDQPVDEEFVLVFKGKNEQIIRPMNLAGCASARITLNWRPKDDVLNARLVGLEFFDGTTWTRQTTFQGAKSDNYRTYTQIIPAQYLVAGAQFRFRGSADMDKEMYFDNIEIDAACAIVPAGTSVGAPSTLVQTGANYAIAPGETATVTFEVTVDATAQKGDVLTNTARAATTEVSTIGSNSVSHTVVTTPSLLGTVYFDANASNSLDAGDPAIGEPMWAKLISGGTVVQVVPVDLATGTYELVEVDGGNYTIIIDDNSSTGDTTPNLPSTWANVNPASGVLPVVSGGDGAPNVTGLDFGLSRSADLELTKTIDDDTPYAGGTVKYTLTVTNTGPATTSRVVVSDQLPAGVTYISHAGTGTFVPGSGTWTVGTLASGQKATVSVLATVNAASIGTVVTNEAEVASMFAIDPDSTPANGVPTEDDFASVDFTVVPPPQAEVALTKSVDVGIAGIGDEITYTIVLTNNGPDPISGGTVTDVLPSILQFETFSTTPIGNGTYDAATGRWLFGALPVGGTSTLKINAVVKNLGYANTPGTVTNSASVDVAPAEDTNLTNNSASASFAIPRADLELVKQVNGADSGTVEILDNLTFTLTLTNKGPDAVTDVVIDDILPSGLIFQGTTASLGAYGQGLWTIPNMPVGTATLDIVATAASGGVIRNVAEVIDVVGIDPDSIAGNRVFSEDDLDDVLVTVTNNGNVTPGLPGSICFPIGDEVGSFGVADLLTRVDKDTGVEEAVSPSGNGTGTRDIESSAIDPETGILYTADGGTFGTIDLDTGVFSAIATIGSGGGYNQNGTRQSIGFSDIDGMHFDKLTGALFASVRREGNNWDLLIQINPATGKPVPNAFDSDGNPATTEEYVVIEPVVSSGSTLSDIDALAVDLDGTLYGAANGSSTTDQVLVRINKITGTTTTVGIVYHNGSKIRDIEGMSFDNQGLLYITTGNGGGIQSGFYDLNKTADPNGRVNTISYTPLGLADDYEAVTCGLPPTDIAVTKTVSDSGPETGDTITYTVDVENLGPTIATGIKISDVLPAGLAYVSHNPNKGIYSTVTDLWDVGGLTVGGTAMLTITARVTAGFGTTITNTAEVVAIDQPEFDLTNNIDDAVLTVGVTPADIRGAVYDDADGSDLIGPGDTPIGGVTVTLYADNDGNGVPDGPALAVTTTKADGTYLFANRSNGRFLVIETDPANYDSVTDIDGLNDNQITVILDGSGTDSNGNDFLDVSPLPPVAVDDASSANPAGPVTLNAIDGSASAGSVADSDPNGDLDPTTVDLDPNTAGKQTTLVVAGEGTWSTDAAGNVTFTPAAGFVLDPTPIPYTVSDSTGLVSNQATITIDYVPVASDDSSTGNTTGAPAVVDVLANDATGDTVDPTTVQIVGTTNPGDPLVVAGEGTWSVDPVTGAITFTPEAGFTGDPTDITYTVDDDEGNTSNPAVVSVNYDQLPPVAVDDASLANPAGPVTLNALDGSASAGTVADSDPNGDLDPTTVDLDPATPGVQATLTVAGEGEFVVDATGNVTFTPEAGFTADPTPIPYTVSDTTGLVSNSATITIDYVPVATDDSSTGNTTGTPVTVDVLANDTTGDAVDPTTVQIVGTTNPGDPLVVAGEGTWSVDPVTGAITFTPEAGFTGDPTNITYTVDDDEGNTSNPAVVSVDYDQLPPVAVDDASLANPAGPVTLNALDGSASGGTADSDPNGDLDPATVDLDPATPGVQATLTVAGEGEFAVDATGNVTFTPEAGFTADPTPIPYTVSDTGGLVSNQATITIDYVPVATDDSSTGNTTGSPAVVDVLANDTTGDVVDPTTVQIVGTANPGDPLVVAGEGTWSVDPVTGAITFTPEAGFTGDPTDITYTVDDDEGNTSNPAVVSVSYDQLPPVAVDDASLANPAGPVALNALDGSASGGTADSDPNGDLDPATVDLDPGTPGVQATLTVAGEGEFVVDAVGKVTFTPEAGFTNDPTPIPYTVSDTGGLVSNQATITIDYVPVATDDSSTGNTTGSPVTVDVLANDTTGDSVDPTTVRIVGTTGPNGDLVVAGEGTWSVDPATGAITFTPEPGFTGDPTNITYTVDDDEGNTSNPAVVSVDYDQLPPVAVDDASLANPAGPVTLNALDGSASGGTADSDPNGDLDPSTVDLDPATPGVQATLTVAGEGEFAVDATGNVTFTPEAGFAADPTPIPYTVSDATGLVSNTATITIDYVPVATDDSSTGNTTGTPVTVDVLANDTTGDVVDPTTVQIVGTANPGDDLVVAGEGTWSVDPATGAITFTPEAGFTADPTDITYTVDDDEGNTSNPAVVTVGYDQQPPVAVDDASLANPAGAVTLNALDGSASTGGVADSDADGDLDPATVDLDPATPGVQSTLTVPGEGEFVVDATGNVTFTPEAGFTNDPTPIPYTVSDTTGLVSNQATITIDYVPVATDDSSTGNTTGTPVTIDVLANDTTGDSVDPTTVQIVGTANPGDDLVVAGEGTWSVDPATGAITFTPEAGFTGDPTDITYTVDDDEGNTSNPAVVAVDYDQLPPVAVDDASLANPAGPVTLNALDGSASTGGVADSDPNGDLDPSTVDLDPATPGVQATLTVAGEGEFVVDATGNVTFTPEAGFTNDPTPIPYTVSDATGLVSNTATITIDYVPVATDDSSTGNTTGTPVTIDVLANDTTGDAVDPTTVQIVGTTNPGDDLVVAGEGTWSVDPATGAITFTPEPGFTADPTDISYTVDDDEGNTSNPAVVAVDYDQLPPVAVDDASLANPAGPVTLNALDGSASVGGVADSDPNGDLDPATVSLSGGTDTDADGDLDELVVAGEGTWKVDETGNVTFTPEAGFTDDPTPVTYRVSDATNLLSNLGTVTIDYVPVATDDSSLGNVTGTPVTVDVLANDTTGDVVDPTTVQIVGTTNPGDDLVVAGEGTWSVDPATGAITFTPEPGFTADPTNITYTVDDDEGNTSNPAVVAVGYDQQPPVAVDDVSSANPAGPVTLNALDGSASAGGVADTDADGDLDPATVDLDPATPGVQATLTVPGEGEFAVDATGNVTFTPEAGFTNDPTPIPYTVSDTGGLVSNQATITIDYVPVATDDSSTGNTTGTPSVVDVLANDTTGDVVDPTTVQIVGTANPGDDLVVAGEGTWSVDPTTGAITFTPEPGFTEDPTDITYTVEDDEGNTSNPAVVSVDYDQLPPVAVDDSSLANPAGAVTLNAVDGSASTGGVADSDPNGDLDPATVDLDPTTPGQQTTLTVAGEGEFAVDATGDVTFTPEAGFTNDPTPIPYTVSDTTGLVSNTATITIDYVPVATDDSSTGNVTNTPVTIDVLANDTTGDVVDPTTVQIVGTTNPGDDLVVAGEGTWSVDPVTGAITFTPEPGFTADPTDITYTVDDDEGNTSNPAVVSVDYAPQPPVAVDDASLANPAGPVTLNAADGTASVGAVADSDPDGTVDVATVDLDPAAPGRQTTLTVAGEGEFVVDAMGNVTFTPEVGFDDDPTPIPYTISDNDGNVSNTATITIDYVPVATDDSSTDNVTNTPVTVDVLANDTTGDVVDPLTVQIIGTTNPGDDLVVAGEGTWSVDPVTGAITFTPEPGFTDDPTDITYTVDDDEGNTSNPAVVSVAYAPQPPIAVSDVSSANPAGPVTLSAVDGSASGGVADSDPDGTVDVATVDLDPAAPGRQTTLTVAGEGEFVVDATGNVTFTPEVGFDDDPTPIPYTISDNDGNVSNTATITIDYVPVATDDASTGNTTGTPAVVDVLANDTTGDVVDPLTVQIVGTTNPGDDLVVAGEGTWSVDPVTGAITFTPESGFTDDPTDITYTVDDDEGNTSNPAVVSVDYAQLPPIAVDDVSPPSPVGPVTLSAVDGSASGGVADSDPNGDLDPATVDLDPATPGIQTTLTVAGEGEFVVDATGSVTFTPEVGFTTDPTPIPYTVSDTGGLVSNVATITIDFVPVATDDASAANPIGVPAIVDVLANDTTGDLVDPLTVQIVGTANAGDDLVVAGEGTWSVDPVSGAITFTPESGFTADPTDITYTVDDDEGNTSNPAKVVVDYVPVATDDSSTGNVTNTPAVVDVLANDTTGDLVDPLTVQIVGTANPGDDLVVAGEGTWSVDPVSGAITFTPESGFTADPTDITYTVDDDEGNTSNPAVVSVSYDPQPPVAVPDQDLGNAIGTTVTLNVLDGSASAGTADSDPDGTLDVTSVDLDPATAGQQTTLVVAGEGTWSVDDAGNVTFVPEASLITDPTPIPYTVSDTDGNVSNEATITIDYVSASGELTVTKSGLYNGTGQVGDTIDYTITVLNSGNVNVFDTVVTDTQADADSITYDVADDGDADLDIDRLAPGESATVTATHTITQVDLDAGSVTNTATATGEDPQGGEVKDDSDSDDPLLPGPDDPTVTPVPQNPLLTITKTDTSIDDVNVPGGDGVFGNVGDVIQYAFTVENIGNVTLTNVTVADLNATVAGGPIATLTPVAPGNIDSTTFTATHVITQPDVDAGQVVNQATATATDPQDDPVTDLSDDPDTPVLDDPTVVLLNLADLSIVKTVTDGSPTHVPGEQISYSLVVTNDGPVVATNTVVTDTLPADATFVTSTPTCSDAAGVLTCDLGDLAIDETVTVTVDVLIGATSTAAQTNVAEVSSDVPDPDPSDNVSTVTTTSSPEADLAIVKTGPATFVPGEPITYTLTATNNGPSEPTAGVVTDTLPAGVTFLADPASSAACTEAAGTVTCTQVGPWPAGTDQVFTIVVDTDSDLLVDLTNTAVTSSELPDPDTSNNTSTLPSTVDPMANLVVDKSGPTVPVAAGTQFDFTITVMNEGPSDALSVALTDVLPAGLSYVNATVSGGAGTEACDNSVACDLGTIAAGATETVTLTVQAGGGATGDVVNLARATTATPGDDPLDSMDTHTVTLTELSNLSITKTDDVDPVEAGGLLRYTLALTNAGPSQATNVTVTDTLPVETEFVSADAACSETGGVVTCDAGTVAVGATPTFQITVRVLSSVADGTQIANTATVAAASDSDNTDNDATETTDVIAVADLRVVKISDPKPFVPGNPLTYTISVFNGGPSDALNVVLTDPLPVGFTAVSVATDLAPGTQCTRVGQDMTCPLGTLAASDQVVITVVGLTDPAATVLENTATATTDTTDSDSTNDSATDLNDGDALADLVVTKTDDADPVVAGSSLKYTISVVNNGPSAAQDVVVTDIVPVGFTVDSVDRAECDTSVSCTFPTIAAGGSETIIVSGTVASDIADTGDPSAPELSNTVTVASATTDPIPGNNTDTETTDVVESANVQLTKIEQGSDVTPGGQLIFTIQVKNAGPSDADDVVVTDTLPQGLTFASAAGATCAPTADPSIVTCDLGTLVAGSPAVIITMTTDVDPGVVGTLVNAATVTSTTPDPEPEDNSDTSEDPTAPDADLSITKSDLSDPVLAGSNLTYVLSGQNSGPSDAVNVVVSDPLPAGTEFVSATFTGGTGTCAADASQVVTCDLGTLSAGDSFSINVVVTVDAGVANLTVLSNTATIAADTDDTDPTNDTSTEDTTVVAEADVGVTKVANFATATPGESIEYEIRVTNFGPSDAQDVSISDDLPAGLSNVAATPSTGTCTLGTPLTCDFGTIAFGDVVVVTITADVDPALLAALDNTVTVTTTTDDPNPDNDVATTATPVDPSADLSLVKDASLTEVVAGTAMSYSIVVTNNGPSDSFDVEIVDTLPPGVTVLGATISDPTGDCTGTTAVTCTLPTLAAGTQVGVAIDVQVDADVADGTVLTNTATVSADTPDNVPDNNTDDADTDVVAEADLTILKVASPDPFVPGQPVTFAITVTNNGPSDAQAVAVADPVPAGLTVTSADTTVGSCQLGDPITCDLGTLAPTGTVTITIVADTDPSIATIVSNTATVTSPTTDPDPGSNESTDTTTPMPTADLVVTKTADLATVQAGTDLTYSVTLSNAGVSTATLVELIDVMPANVTYVSHTQTSTLGTCAHETAGDTVRCTAPALVPGEVISVDITVTVDSDTPVGSSVVNTATKTSTTPDPERDNDESTTTTPVEILADLAIDKTLITNPLVPGQSAQYSLVVTNNGPSDAADVEVADTMPAGLAVTTILTTQGTCVDDSVSANCDLGTVAAGATVTITITVDVAADVIDDVVNTATVTSTTEDPNPDDNTDTTTDTPSPSADLVITKTTVNVPIPGRSVDYVLSISNGGPSNALDVTVTDTLVDGLVATSAVSEQGTCAIVDSAITCDLGTVEAGASFNVTISADIDPALVGTLVNTATVESPTTPDPDPDNNTSTVDDPLRPSADLQLVKTVNPDPFVPGEQLTYTLTITNAGPSEATDITITDKMPTGITPVSVDTVNGTCTIAGATVTCTNSTIAVDATAVVTIVADSDPAITAGVTNTASVTASTPDPIPANNTSTVPADPTPQADVRVVKTGPATAVGGTSVTYTITATNNGASVATDVVITDTLDTAMVFIGAETGCAAAAGVVTCTPVDLDPGEQHVVGITVELADTSQPSTVSNTAAATAATPDPDPTNNTSSVTTKVTPEPAIITGIVWNDIDGDGIRDANETGIGGVTVTVTGDPDGDGTPTVITLVTDDQGRYRTEVPPGTWTIEVDPASYPPNLTPTTPLTTTVTVGPGQERVVESGLGSGTITGQVWLDANANGIIDPGENDISGVRIEAVCPGPDGIAGTGDDMVFSTVTASPYVITGVPIQSCTVRVVTDTLPANIRQTFDPDGVLDHITIVTITAPGTTAVADFGYMSKSDIPVTGSDTGVVLRLALLIVALGGALLIVGRRRRRTLTTR